MDTWSYGNEITIENRTYRMVHKHGLQAGMTIEDGACDTSPSADFTDVQLAFRAYAMPITYICGIFFNCINILVYTRRSMRRQPINWFFLALSISDLSVLVSSFFVFSVPVYAESCNRTGALISAYLIILFYPIAQSSLTCSVYLTVLVALHRYVAICHPFSASRRINNRCTVRILLATMVCWSLIFNCTRWFELSIQNCVANRNNITQVIPVVVPTEFMFGEKYTIYYRNGAYSFVMFFLPFFSLIYLNVRIIFAIRESNRTLGGFINREKFPSVSATNGQKADVITVAGGNNVSTALLKKPANTHCGNERSKEQNISLMLVAIMTFFMLFNVLAFINNVMELIGAYTASFLETLLVEISALLVNLWGACTILVYIAFSSKYRKVLIETVGCNNFKRWYTSRRTTGQATTSGVKETTLDSRFAESQRHRSICMKNHGANLRIPENRRYSSRDISVRNHVPMRELTPLKRAVTIENSDH